MLSFKQRHSQNFQVEGKGSSVLILIAEGFDWTLPYGRISVNDEVKMAWMSVNGGAHDISASALTSSLASHQLCRTFLSTTWPLGFPLATSLYDTRPRAVPKGKGFLVLHVWSYGRAHRYRPMGILRCVANVTRILFLPVLSAVTPFPNPCCLFLVACCCEFLKLTFRLFPVV